MLTKGNFFAWPLVTSRKALVPMSTAYIHLICGAVMRLYRFGRARLESAPCFMSY